MQELTKDFYEMLSTFLGVKIESMKELFLYDKFFQIKRLLEKEFSKDIISIKNNTIYLSFSLHKSIPIMIDVDISSRTLKIYTEAKTHLEEDLENFDINYLVNIINIIKLNILISSDYIDGKISNLSEDIKDLSILTIEGKIEKFRVKLTNENEFEVDSSFGQVYVKDIQNLYSYLCNMIHLLKKICKE